jgi:predicted tellurium resistance membrane protein TerC
VLIFIGAKMVGEHFVPIPTEVSLLIVGGILGVAVAASLVKTKRRSG